MFDFYLASTELREAYEPLACRIIRRMRSELRDDLALVEVEPPLPRRVYDTTQDVRWLIIASRLKGTTLFPVSEWPLPVYICRVKGKYERASKAIMEEDLAILDWGEIRRTAAP
jgi:hypothetical protein